MPCVYALPFVLTCREIFTALRLGAAAAWLRRLAASLGPLRFGPLRFGPLRFGPLRCRVAMTGYNLSPQVKDGLYPNGGVGG